MNEDWYLLFLLNCIKKNMLAGDGSVLLFLTIFLFLPGRPPVLRGRDGDGGSRAGAGYRAGEASLF